LKDTIIIVEDNQDFGKVLSKSMSVSFPDYNVEWFQTGVSAAEAIDDGLRPIAGLIDTILPDTHGTNIARYILESTPEAKLIQITGYASREFEIDALRYAALDFIIKPFNIHHARNLLEHAIERYKISKKKTLLIQDVKMMMEVGQSFHFGSILSLITTLEKHSEVLQNVSLKVMKAAMQIGEKLGISDAEMKQLRYTSLLYDIGKISDEDEIVVGKTKTSITDTWTLFKLILLIVRSIYEWWDGTGFPQQLKGKEIPYLSRIISVAFGFTYLTVERISHKGFTVDETLQIMRNYSGKQYDPDIVEALVSLNSKL
jgi:response regulator RpfG family c-di-GMP phosphodiesterase